MPSRLQVFRVLSHWHKCHLTFFVSNVYPAKQEILGVDLTRLELVTSAMRRQHDALLEVSRVCKIPANWRIYQCSAFPEFSGSLSGLLHGCCTRSALGRTRTWNLE